MILLLAAAHAQTPSDATLLPAAETEFAELQAIILRLRESAEEDGDRSRAACVARAAEHLRILHAQAQEAGRDLRGSNAAEAQIRLGRAVDAAQERVAAASLCEAHAVGARSRLAPFREPEPWRWPSGERWYDVTGLVGEVQAVGGGVLRGPVLETETVDMDYGDSDPLSGSSLWQIQGSLAGRVGPIWGRGFIGLGIRPGRQEVVSEGDVYWFTRGTTYSGGLALGLAVPVEPLAVAAGWRVAATHIDEKGASRVGEVDWTGGWVTHGPEVSVWVRPRGEAFAVMITGFLADPVHPAGFELAFGFMLGEP